jgi:hypothetical protein
LVSKPTVGPSPVRAEVQISLVAGVKLAHLLGVERTAAAPAEYGDLMADLDFVHGRTAE